MDASSMQTLIILSLVIALVPTVLCVATCYLKISIVLGMIKNALGTNSTPGVMITAALSLMLTAYIMKPVIEESVSLYASSKQKNWNLLADPEARKAMNVILEPFTRFFDKHSGNVEKKFFSRLNNHDQDPQKETTAIFTVLPSFTLTELREAFQMSCYLLLPFLVIDLLVATLLGGMGLYMVSPVSIALPLKLLLFVASDCWLVLSKGLILSYQ